MKLIHIDNGEETVIMEAPHEDGLKARASKVKGYPEDADWRLGTSEKTGQSSTDASGTEPLELELKDGSLLRITKN